MRGEGEVGAAIVGRTGPGVRAPPETGPRTVLDTTPAPGPAVDTARSPSTRPVGLTSAAAAARLAEVGPNSIPESEGASLASRLLRELREPMALLLIAAASVSGGLLGEPAEAIAIVVIVVVNAVIALVQEGRAAQALRALEELEAPTAAVVRDGRQQVVAAASLVPGDLVVVQAGDRVPADLLLVDGDAIEVDEAMLTGESLPVTKRAGFGAETADGDDSTAPPDRLSSGTLLTRGAGRGVVTATGAATALGAIAEHLTEARREPTPLQRQLAGLTRRLGLAAVLVAGGAFAMSLLLVDTTTDEAFLIAVALAVAAVPEGLAAVTTVALALGVSRMARHGAIVRRLPAVETLGAVDVLVVDKTGTVTQNRMQAEHALTPDQQRFDVPTAAALRPSFGATLALCNDATLDPPTGDPTEQALLEFVTPDVVADWRQRAPRITAGPFTSERRRMSTLHRIDDGLHLLVKGAPEGVLPLCTQAWRDGRMVPLGPSDHVDLLALVEATAAGGRRILAVAERSLDAVPDDLEAAEDDLVLLGLVVLRDPPRESASASVAAVRAAGIRLIMATGDHPATATAIAHEVGLDGDTVVTGDAIRDGGPEFRATEAHVLARVNPHQKLDVVTTLQADGHIVGMTGDGVNDAPALRRADIGVALGRTGSDVAREAADVVITDDDLATIVTAVHEGRSIHDNLRKVVDYLVASNLSEVVVVLSTLVLVPSLGVPLFPLQLLWINLLTDGLPALALGVDPPDAGIGTRPPRDPGARLLDLPHLRILAGRGGALAIGALAVLLVAHHLTDLTPEQSRTVLFTALVVGQTAYAWVVRRPAAFRGRMPANPWLLGSTVASLLLQVTIVTVSPLAGLFDTASLPATGWLLAVGGGVSGPALIAGVRWATAPRR